MLIAFGGIASRLDGIPPFEFLSALNAHAARRIFVRDLDQCWYQRGVRGASSTLAETTTALHALVDASAPSRLVTLGTSAGGFAAIFFGAALGADRALAFGPQTFTSTRLRRWYRDHRWTTEIGSIDDLDQSLVCRDLLPVVRRTARAGRSPSIDIHVGRDSRIDRVHARRLRRVANVTVHAHAGGHNVAKELRDRGELDAILARLVSPGLKPVE